MSETNKRPDPPVRLRMWPAVAIACIHFMVAHGFSRFGTTNIENAIALGGVPLLAVLSLLVWWIAASRMPWRIRGLGLVMVLVACGAVVFSQASSGLGALLLARALPFLIYGVVLMLLVTYPLSRSLRGGAIAVLLVAWACVFCALRVDSIGGDLAPVVSWRWQPTASELSERLPHFDSQKSADLPAALSPEDSPAFRGANREGRVTGVRFSTDWTVPPREVWRQPVGPGWSSFVVVGDYLFTQEQRGSKELVTCYRADTGVPIWQNQVEAQFEDAMGLGPRATPTFSDGALYVQGGTGIVQRLNATTGETLWKRDVVQDTEAGVPQYGFSSSPLVVDDLVVTFVSGAATSAIAYHRGDGAVAWRSGQRASGYSSPHWAVLEGVPQVLLVSNQGMESLNSETGASLWHHDWKIQTNPRCVQPVVVDNNTVMFGGTGTSGARLLRVEQEDDTWRVEDLWTTRQFRPYFNNGVLHKGHYYGYDGERIACLDMETGKRLWAGERYSGQLLLIEDMDMLLILSESGDVALVAAVPETFTEIARFKALTGKTWNHPVISRGRLYVRNSQEAACFELPPPVE